MTLVTVGVTSGGGLTAIAASKIFARRRTKMKPQETKEKTNRIGEKNGNYD